mmetsp:Transcript_38621/g.61892  ORF Transcript_38621/g.61892 Transcript_38621/m.61892 type:complete len:220 (-) Transcript_38621:501-1160(-)
MRSSTTRSRASATSRCATSTLTTKTSPRSSSQCATHRSLSLAFWASSWGTRWRTPTRWCCGRRSLAILPTAHRSLSISSSPRARRSGCGNLASFYYYHTGTMDRVPSIAAVGSSVTCRCPTKTPERCQSTWTSSTARKSKNTTGRSATSPPRQTTSTCCAVRCTATSASLLSWCRPKTSCVIPSASLPCPTSTMRKFHTWSRASASSASSWTRRPSRAT